MNCPASLLLRRHLSVGNVVVSTLCQTSRRSAYISSKNHLVDIKPGPTAVLLLHEGEPNDVDEAVEYKINRFREFFCLPRFTINYLRYLATKFNWHKSLEQFFRRGTDFRHVQVAQRNALELNLQRLLPELGPYRCYTAYLREASSLQTAIDAIKTESVSRVFVLSQYPQYWCFQSGTCINSLSNYLNQWSSPVEPRRQHVRQWKMKNVEGGDEEGNKKNHRGCVQWSLIDRWSAHPALTDVYSRLIQNEISYFPYDVQHEVALLFCAPAFRGYDRLQYRREVAAGCQRISEQLYHRYPHRIGFFNKWSQLAVPLGKSGVIRVMRDLVRSGRANILIVPVCETTNSIDTEFVLKSLLSEKVLKSTGAQYVRFVPPPNDHPAFIQGLAEIVKNHYLNDNGPSSQFSLRCRYCIWPSCTLSRHIFT